MSGSTVVLAGSTGRTMAGSTGPSTGATSVSVFRYWTLVVLTGSFPGSGSGSTGSIGTTGPFPGSTGPAGFRS